LSIVKVLSIFLKIFILTSLLQGEEKKRVESSIKKMFLHLSVPQYGAANPDEDCFKERPKGTLNSVAIVSLSKKSSMRDLIYKTGIPQDVPIYDVRGKIQIAQNLKELVTGPGTLSVDLNEVLDTPFFYAWSGSKASGEEGAGIECCNCWNWRKANGVSGSLLALYGTSKDPNWRGGGMGACIDKNPFLCVSW
jgi:hypothetical protein